MHGIIFSEMRKFVDTKLGSDGWNRLLLDSELGKRMYLPIQEYPDGDMVALVTAASRCLNVPADAILEEFGQFIAPSLVGLYRTLVKPEWKTLDLLEHTEHTIHSVVRARNPGAKPAQLNAVRRSPDVVDLTYRSDRRLCAVAKGIVRGVANHYGETVTITETECMHDGGEVCQMEVRVGAAVKAAPEKAPARATEMVAAKKATVAGDAKPAGKKPASAANAKTAPKKAVLTAANPKTAPTKAPSAAKPKPSAKRPARAKK